MTSIKIPTPPVIASPFKYSSHVGQITLETYLSTGGPALCFRENDGALITSCTLPGNGLRRNELAIISLSMYEALLKQHVVRLAHRWVSHGDYQLPVTYLDAP